MAKSESLSWRNGVCSKRGTIMQVCLTTNTEQTLIAVLVSAARDVTKAAQKPSPSA